MQRLQVSNTDAPTHESFGADSLCLCLCVEQRSYDLFPCPCFQFDFDAPLPEHCTVGAVPQHCCPRNSLWFLLLLPEDGAVGKIMFCLYTLAHTPTIAAAVGINFDSQFRHWQVSRPSLTSLPANRTTLE